MKAYSPSRPRRSRIPFAAALTIILVASGAALISQRAQTKELLATRELERMAASQIETLRAENQKLRAAQISSAELESLRADRAALVRLRAELDTLSRPAP